MKSIRLSFLSYDSSAATETSVRGKGLSNSTEYVPTTCTMEDDALLYIKRAEYVRQKETSARSQGFASRNENEGLAKKYFVYKKAEKLERKNSNGVVKHNEKRRHRSPSPSVYSNTSLTVPKRRERRESTEKTRRSVLSFIVPQKNLSSLCILVVLLAVALFAIITLVLKGEGFFGFGTRAIGSGQSGNTNENPSETPSLGPMYYSTSPSGTYHEWSNSPSVTRQGSFSTKSPGMKKTSIAPTTSSMLSMTSFPTKPESNSNSKTIEPSNVPSGGPSQRPSIWVSSIKPSIMKNKHASQTPSWTSTKAPTRKPTLEPSRNPSVQPTRYPSKHPSQRPTRKPSQTPSKLPSKQPTEEPIIHPSESPTKTVTRRPSARPSKLPTRYPSSIPTTNPTQLPSETKSSSPSQRPTKKPKRRLL